MKRECRNCHYWRRGGDGSTGECLYWPEVVAVEGRVETAWATTESDRYCSGHLLEADYYTPKERDYESPPEWFWGALVGLLLGVFLWAVSS